MEDRYFNILVVGTPHVGKSRLLLLITPFILSVLSILSILYFRIISKYLNDNFNTILRTPSNIVYSFLKKKLICNYIL